MVFALAGDSTTTTFIGRLLPSLVPGRGPLSGRQPGGGQSPPAEASSETRLPGCHCRRPASSSSSRVILRKGGDKWHCRPSSSTGTGLGPRRRSTSETAEFGRSSNVLEDSATSE